MSVRSSDKHITGNPTKEVLGRDLKSLLRAKGHTQEAFAAEVRTSRQYLSRILTGKARKVSSDVIRRICAALEAPPHLLHALIKAYTNEFISELGDEIDDQVGKTVWLFSSRLKAAHDGEIAKQVQSNLKKGSTYVFWSDDENEFKRLVAALEPGIDPQELNRGLTCIVGPRWLRFMMWRVIEPDAIPSVFRMETRSRIPMHGVPADVVLGDDLWEYFSPILDSVRTRPGDDVDGFRLVFPPKEQHREISDSQNHDSE